MPRRRFTLIEMLVVIAIISILASLLAPSLRRSLRAANALTCLNNLHQISVWALGYVSDNNGFLPIHNSYSEKDVYVYKYAYDWLDVLRDDGLRSPQDLLAGSGLSCRELRSVHGGRLHTMTQNVGYGLNGLMGGRIVKVHGKEQPAARERLLSGKKFWFADGIIFKSGSNRLDIKQEINLNYSKYGADGCPNGSSGNLEGPWCWGAPGVEDTFGDLVNPSHGHTGVMDANFVFGDGHAKSVGFVEFFTFNDTEKKTFVGY